MKLTPQERQAIVYNRVQKSLKTWEEAKSIIDSKLWYAAANRMYYACYYMTSALLIKNNYQASTHAGVIRLFGQHFVSSEIIDIKFGRFYSKLFELRQSGDYDDWKLIEEKDILPLVEPAKEFLKILRILIDS